MIRQYILPGQAALYEATQRVVSFVAGYGTGKTRGACIKALQLSQVNDGLPGAFIEPTYKMIDDVALPMFIELLDDTGVPYKVEKAKNNVLIYWSRKPSIVRFRSADKPEKLKGTNLAWAIIDEAGICPEEAYIQANARVGRAAGTRLAQLILCGTPEGGPGTPFGRWAQFDPPEDSLLIRAKTEDNPFLPKAYLKSLKDTLSPTEYLAYCEGFFVAEGGQIYRFDQQRHVDKVQLPRQDEVQIYADFNVGKMVWLIGKEVNGKYAVVDEVVGENTYTEEHIPRLKERLEAMGLNSTGVSFYGDASANHRSTSTAISDVAHLRRAGFKYYSPKQNPPVKDRIASMNNLFAQDRITIDPRCKYLITCLATQGRDSNGNPDKSNDMDHPNDALGYGMYYQEPVVAPSGNAGRYQ